MQDRQGMIWLTNQTGLDKYIGSRILPVTGFQKGLTETISYLCDWDENYVLVSTDISNYLIHKWDLDKQSIPLNARLKNIKHLATVGRDSFLIFTNDKIALVNRRLELLNPKPIELKEATILEVVQHPKGQFYIGTINGLLYFDYWKNTSPHFLPALLDVKINALCFNAEASILFCGSVNSFVYKFDVKTELAPRMQIQEKGLPSTLITSLLYRDQKLWVGTEEDGLYILDSSQQYKIIKHFHPQEKFHSNIHFSSKNVTCLYQSKDNVIWVGTKIGGLNVWHPGRQDFQHILWRGANSDDRILSGNDVWSIYVDTLSNRTLIGVKESGVAIIDNNAKTILGWLSPEDKENMAAASVMVIKRLDNELFMGTKDGIYKYNMQYLAGEHTYRRVRKGIEILKG